MTKERFTSNEELTTKWDEFFNKSMGASPRELTELIRDVVNLRYRSLVGEQVELLSSKFYIMIGFSEQSQSAYISLQKKPEIYGAGNSIPGETFRISWKKSLAGAKISDYRSEYQNGVSAFFNNQVLKAKEFGVRLTPKQILDLGQKIWNSYKVTETWTSMEGVYGG